MSEDTKTWGYTLEAPRRPPLKKQLEILASNGVDISAFGPVWSDKIARPKRGVGAKPENQRLPARDDLLRVVRSGDRIIVADAYCVGLTPDDAERFMIALASAEASLTVCGQIFHVDPGASTADLVKEIERKQNAAYVAAYRARKKKRKRKST